jgi:hypothetical protein
MRRSTLGWAALAVAGLLIAAGAAYAASRIATQPIGLSSEPISAGRQLAPRADATPRPARKRTPPTKHKRRPRKTPTARPTATPTAAPTIAPTAAPTVDDHGGGRGSSGKGKGGGSDD